MAVAVKNSTETTTRSGPMNLIAASLGGALYVLAGIAIVAQVIPRLWAAGVSSWMPPSLSFVDAAGLIVALVAAVVGLVLFGKTLLGSNPPKGIRAGVFTVLVWLLLTVWVATIVGRFFGWLTGADALGLAGMAIAAAGMLFWGWRLMQRPKTPESLESFEAQGWFSADRYKPMQGLRVRRATMLGLLVLLGAGVWVLSEQNLGAGGKDWVLKIPFTNWQIPLLPDVAITLPVVLGALAFWVSYRMVNWPVFADFLIATEAEVNKISWPSRKSVIQDTIVVLTTVFLLTVFLFAVDLAWGALLGSKWVGILRLEPNKPAAAQTADQIDW
jgi:preprotein translocase SecE subunit